MTDEQDFQDALDAEPDNHTLRLVFADWLQEQGDERADGYRAIARHPLEPTDHRGQKEDVGFAYWRNKPVPTGMNSLTWIQWWELVEDGHPYEGYIMGKFFRSISSGESAFARAFLLLPAERRAELLSVPVLSPVGV